MKKRNDIVIKKMPVLMFLALIIVVIEMNASFSAEYDYINISNPFLNKIPIAVPFFRPMAEGSAEKKMAREASDLLSETLEFTGFFKILNRGAFLEEPSEKGIVASRINFRNWRTVGAELLITGGILIHNDKVDMEFRLFDTFKEKLVIGKRYKGSPDDMRQMVRRFAREIIYRLTGNIGIFESKIAFVSSSSGTKELYICDFDGYNPKKITQKSNMTFAPAWSSDGRYLAFTSYARGRPDLFIKNLSGKRGAVINFQGVNLTPSWVPGKFELAASLSFSGDQEIYLLTGTGKIIKRLTNQWDIDVSPSFSPDGKKMAFVSRRSGSPQIHVMDMSSGNVKRITFQGYYNTSPSWSPVDDKIVYVGMINNEINIYMIEEKGGVAIQLTQQSGDNEFPTWSPDGSLITFSSTREGKSRIYVMTAFGTDQRRLLTMPGEQSSPRWSPAEIKD
ncbi:MAG: Tol-Pal system beta propeller repeat protein TolB [Proteobacteria bacterium]|nr:Tol-Pal system beta propeller repeat protein TolB [Pseudomonadota bacterium]